MKTKLFLMTLLVAGLFSSCAKKNDTTTSGGGTTYDDSYTINGGGFTNTVYNISNVSQQTSNYNASSGLTTVSISGASGDSSGIEYEISFAGHTAGTYSLTAGNGNVFSITTTPLSNSNGLQIFTSNAGAKLVVTNYGASGGKISGTFSGTFNNTGNNYTISGGTFSAVVQ